MNLYNYDTVTKIEDPNGGYISETLEQLLEEVVQSITLQHPEAKVILFGSYARGDYTVDSDLDFCVLVPEFWDRRLEVVTDIRGAIRRGFPMPKDVVTFTFEEFEEFSQVPSRLEYVIKEEGRVLNV